MFAWEAYERGADVHLQADPTKLELLHKEFKVKKEKFEKGQKESILEKVILTLYHFLVLFVISLYFMLRQYKLCRTHLRYYIFAGFAL